MTLLHIDATMTTSLRRTNAEYIATIRKRIDTQLGTSPIHNTETYVIWINALMNIEHFYRFEARMKDVKRIVLLRKMSELLFTHKSNCVEITSRELSTIIFISLTHDF